MLSGRYSKVFSYGNENLDSESMLFETVYLKSTQVFSL